MYIVISNEMAIPVKQSDPVHPSMQEHVLGCVHSILVPHPGTHTAIWQK